MKIILQNSVTSTHKPTSQQNHNNTHALEEKNWHKSDSVDGAITQNIT